MPRKARFLLPNTPHHILQRGHNRQLVFPGPGDFRYYLANLAEWKQKLDIKVYSFCLMTNHIHLIAEPGDDAETISKLMKRLAGRQTRYYNKREERTGTLWESRFKASPIQRDAYLLQCCRYVERNPVAAGMVANPADYPWSSYCHRIGKQQMSWLDEIEYFDPCGNDETRKMARYKKFVESGQDHERRFFRTAVHRNQLTGSGKFIEDVTAMLGAKFETRGRGRPRKK